MHDEVSDDSKPDTMKRTNRQGETVEITGNPLSILAAFTRWMISQEIRDVMLIATQVAVGLAIYFAAREGIPKGLAQIQDGYDRLAAQLEVTRQAERTADNERYETHREVDADRYQWIREMWLNMKAKVGFFPGDLPKDVAPVVGVRGEKDVGS